MEDPTYSISSPILLFYSLILFSSLRVQYGMVSLNLYTPNLVTVPIVSIGVLKPNLDDITSISAGFKRQSTDFKLKYVYLLL